MSRYDFAPQFGGATDAITQLLMERKAEARQAMLDQIAVTDKIENTRRFDASHKFQVEQEARINMQQKRQYDDLAYERRGDRVDALVDDSVPGDIHDEKTMAELREFGRGGTFTEQPASPGIMAGVDDAGEMLTPEQAAQPAQGVAKGGSKYLVAEAGRVAQGQREKAAQEARAEQNAITIESREGIAAAGRTTAAAIAGMGNAARADRDRDKADAKQTASDEKDAADYQRGRMRTAETLAAIDKLIVPQKDAEGKITSYQLKPGVAEAVGGSTMNPLNYLPGSPAATARTDIDRLRNRTGIDLITEMKSQSKTGATGFGALTAPELALLLSDVANLSTIQDDKSFLLELGRIRAQMELMLQDPAPSAKTSGAMAPGGAPRKYKATVS